MKKGDYLRESAEALVLSHFLTAVARVYSKDHEIYTNTHVVHMRAWEFIIYVPHVKPQCYPKLRSSLA